MSRAPETAPPLHRDPARLGVLAFVCALLIAALAGEEGYQIADSVEYMERALIFVRGDEMVDAGAIRPFGFSSLLVPFFVLSDWFGVPALRPLAWSVTGLQMLLGLALVAACMRIGTRLGGRSTGLVAGVLVGVNPIFLQYAVQPVSGVATGLFVALALDELLERQGFKRSLVGGLWLGAAFLMKYQTILIVASIAVMIAARDRWKHRAPLGGMTLGVGIALLVQIVLDKLTYGVFGLSVWNHFVQNFGQMTVTVLHSASQRAPEPIAEPLLDAATTIYGWVNEAAQGGRAEVNRTVEDLPSIVQRWFYVLFLPRMLVWPAIALGALAVVRSVFRPSWKSTLLLGVIAINALVMSYKSSKEFRLWLPLLGALAPFLALGCTALVAEGRLRFVRVAALVLALAAAVPLARRELAEENTRKFGGYWQAMAYVNRHARETLPERARLARADTPPLVVGSAYNWAVYMRQSPLVHLVKLPWQLNSWNGYTPESRKREQDLDALDELDAFVTHLPILENHPDLFEWVNRHFAVAAAFYDQATYEELGPIFVLERRRGGRDDKRFFELATKGATDGAASRAAYRARWQLDGGARFAAEPDRVDGTREELYLLGFEYDVLPPQGLGWISYHWTSPTGLTRDYRVIDRLTAPDERNAWDNGHRPAYGLAPTTAWSPGTLVREGYLVVASAEPFLPGAPYRPIGDGFRRGDLIPVKLWMKLVEYDAEAYARRELIELARLARVHDWTGAPIPQPPEEGRLSPTGVLFTPDGLSAVGAFMLPVQPRARVPDDGRPIPPDR